MIDVSPKIASCDTFETENYNFFTFVKQKTERNAFMKNRILSFLSLLLVIVMITAAFAGCADETEETTDPSAENTTESAGDGTDESESKIESDSEKGEDSTDDISGEVIELTGPHADVIENANALANGVNAYFPDETRRNFYIENQNMSLDYSLHQSTEQLVSYIKNTEGKSYIENTMDVFVTMKNGSTFYASKTNTPTYPNLYRMGYYMYEMRLKNQTFATDVSDSEFVSIDVSKSRVLNDIQKRMTADDALLCLIKAERDPSISFTDVSFSADKFNYIQITAKADLAESRGINIYLKAGGSTSFTEAQMLSGRIEPSDEYVTINIPVVGVPNYTGDVTGIRLDINGKAGESVTIKEFKVLDAGDALPPNLSLNRSFYTYSDKMHHRIQISSHDGPTTDIAEIGMITKIAKDTVAKLVVADKNGSHDSIADVDWASAEYIGFDIKDAGIFGYILPVDETTGKMTVTEEDGFYVITQSRTPENNTIINSGVYSPELAAKDIKNPFETIVDNNANDFYMGQRIYTDENHDFEEFLKEAYIERNPLKLITVDKDSSDEGSYDGYDALRGVYHFTLKGTGFNVAHKAEPNKQYRLEFTLKGDDVDRNIYILTYTDTGCLESAVLLDENLMMLPVPLEVGKNFPGDGEADQYFMNDVGFSDTLFPLAIGADERLNYTVVNIYENWGNYPLKQISWIQFHCPYYHLSTGTVESNCIMPWYTTAPNDRQIDAVLPDHRPASGTWWSDQPQHTSGGHHSFLEYTDKDGNYVTSENIKNIIDSYGPTYSDIQMDYISDDGKIAASYTHIEMPQTDENRAYYEMTYEVLEDVTIKNFRSDFAFYSVTDNNSDGDYAHFGYLNENNESIIADRNTSTDPVYYVLGDNCPYFDYFEIVDAQGNLLDHTGTQPGFVNLSLLVYNSEFIIGGEKSDVSFTVKEVDCKASLSLDLGEVTLKKGDKFTINAIIMPWGSEETDYSSASPDKNVRDVRANTLIDPLKATAEADCTVLESPFLPKIETTNGKSAEFTLSGGHNNVAVRIYGFDMLTAPKVYEKIDGEWVEYILSSSKSPDVAGNYQYYDGYCVYYDGDGTYSYSFVTDITNGAPRTFKITADEEFSKWPKVEQIELEDPIELYLDPNELLPGVLKFPKLFGTKDILFDDDGTKYIHLTGNGSPEGYFYPLERGEEVTGQYVVIKYRVPTDNAEALGSLEIFTSTVNDTDAPLSVIGKESYTLHNSVIADGNWHIIVADMSKLNSGNFIANDDSEYVAKYLRVDVFNGKVSESTAIDLAYIGFSTSLESIFAIDTSVKSVLLYESLSKPAFVDASGTPTGETPNNPSVDQPSLQGLKIEPAALLNWITRYPVNMSAKAPTSQNGISYLTAVSQEGGAGEGYFHFMVNGNGTPAGRYIAIKYRTSDTGNIEVWGTTSAVYTTGDNAGQAKPDPARVEATDCVTIDSAKGFNASGKWQLLVVDLEKALPNYKAGDDGVYKPYIMRLDLFGNTKNVSEQLTVDLSYISFGDDLNELLAQETRLKTASFFDGKTFKTLSTADGSETEPDDSDDGSGDVADNTELLNYTIRLDASALAANAKGHCANVTAGEVATADGMTYLPFTSVSNTPEGYFFFLLNSDLSQTTGKYMAVKYRSAATSDIEVWGTCSSVYTTGDKIGQPKSNVLAFEGTDGYAIPKNKGFNADGEWQLLVLNLENILVNYKANASGKYKPYVMRLDLFGSTSGMTEELTVDISYIEFGNTLEKVLADETALTTATFFDGVSVKQLYTATGAEVAD